MVSRVRGEERVGGVGGVRRVRGARRGAARQGARVGSTAGRRRDALDAREGRQDVRDRARDDERAIGAERAERGERERTPDAGGDADGGRGRGRELRVRAGDRGRARARDAARALVSGYPVTANDARSHGSIDDDDDDDDDDERRVDATRRRRARASLARALPRPMGRPSPRQAPRRRRVRAHRRARARADAVGLERAVAVRRNRRGGNLLLRMRSPPSRRSRARASMTAVRSRVFSPRSIHRARSVFTDFSIGDASSPRRRRSRAGLRRRSPRRGVDASRRLCISIEGDARAMRTPRRARSRRERIQREVRTRATRGGDGARGGVAGARRRAGAAGERREAPRRRAERGDDSGRG